MPLGRARRHQHQVGGEQQRPGGEHAVTADVDQRAGRLTGRGLECGQRRAQVLARVVKTERIPNLPYDFRLFM